MVVYLGCKEQNYKCEDDANSYVLVNAGVGLLSYDEVLHAGGYYGKYNW